MATARCEPKRPIGPAAKWKSTANSIRESSCYRSRVCTPSTCGYTRSGIARVTIGPSNIAIILGVTPSARCTRGRTVHQHRQRVFPTNPPSSDLTRRSRDESLSVEDNKSFDLSGRGGGGEGRKEERREYGKDGKGAARPPRLDHEGAIVVVVVVVVMTCGSSDDLSSLPSTEPCRGRGFDATCPLSREMRAFRSRDRAKQMRTGQVAAHKDERF